MPLIPINAVGQIGLLSDKPSHELPLNAWSDGKNVRFRDTFAEKFLGQTQVYDPVSAAPYNVFPVISGTNFFWLVAGLNKLYAIDGMTWYDITRAVGGNYAATATKNWTGGMLGGVPVVNNGVDVPQMWLNPAGVNLAADLSNWPVGYTCQALRPFKSFLVALDINTGTTRYPQMVKWSHEAVVGSVPASWDPSDPAYDAGEYTLMESPGYCIDCLPMRDVNIIYKDDSVWTMQYIGGTNIFRFARVFATIGMLAKRCAVEFFSGKHVVLGQDDLVVHNANSAESIISKKLKRWLFNNIDSNYFTRCFLLHNLREREVWVCFPESGTTTQLCTLALVWNYLDNQLSVRELPGIDGGNLGLISSSYAGTTWSADSLAWDSDSTDWGDGNYSSASPRSLLADPTNSKLLDVESSLNFNGTSMNCYLERTGLGVPFKVDAPPDISSRKFFRGLWPRIEGTDGGVVRIRLGVQDKVDTPVSWDESYDFVIGTDDHVDCALNGRLFAVRFESSTDIEWRLHGYDVDVQPAGTF